MSKPNVIINLPMDLDDVAKLLNACPKGSRMQRDPDHPDQIGIRFKPVLSVDADELRRVLKDAIVCIRCGMCDDCKYRPYPECTAGESKKCFEYDTLQAINKVLESYEQYEYGK